MTPFLRWPFLFALMVPAMLAAQQPAMKKMEVGERNSRLVIRHIEQDASGYVWIGSDQGILRYTGRGSSSLSLPESVRQQAVTALHIDGHDLLAGFSNGWTYTYNIVTGEGTAQRISSVSISACLSGAQGERWWGTTGDGLFLQQGDQVTHYSTTNGLSDMVIHDLLAVGQQVAVATDLGITIIEWNGTSHQLSVLNNEDGLCDNLILCLAKGQDDQLLAGAHNGSVCSIHLRSRVVTPFPSFTAVNASPVIRVLRVENEIWAVTEDRSLVILNWPDDGHFQWLELRDAAVSQGSPSDVLRTTEGLLLLANGTSSLESADNRSVYFREHDGESFANAHALACDANGSIWFSTDQGIFRHDVVFSTDAIVEAVLKSPFAADVISLSEGPDGAMWFGTFGKGLGRIDPVTQKVRFYTEKEGLVNDNILSIAQDGNALWLATLGGACRLLPGDPLQVENYGQGSQLGSSYVYAVHAGRSGKVWFGTDGKGLAWMEGGQFFFLRELFAASPRTVVSIAEDTNGAVWMYAPDDGLSVFDGKTWKRVDTRELEPLEVFALQSDHEGKVIVFTSMGIGTISTRDPVLRLLENNGNYASDYLNVATTDQFGQIWIGSRDAMMRYREYAAASVTRPIARIEEMLVMLQPADTNTHVFAPDQTHFSFRINGLWYQQPEEVRYQYKLDGHDLDWVNTLDPVIVFSRLNPGEYTFRVRAYIGNDPNNSTEANFRFEVLAPLWKRPWFVILAVTALILLMAVFVRIRVRNLQRKEALQKELFQSQFETLRNQVNPHFLFNSFNTLISTIARDKDQAIGYVEKLSDYFRIILQQRDKDVITLREELELVGDYFFLQKMRFGENLRIQVDVDERSLDELIPPMTLQILAENAIKHNVISSSRPLSVVIRSTDDDLVMENNLQEKRSKEPSTGVGLQNIRNRYRILFGKEIQVSAAGDTFAVHLPRISVS